MKKLIMTLLLCVGVYLPGFCLMFDYYVYPVGNFQYTVDPAIERTEDMSKKEILSVINKGGFLPLQVGHQMAFLETGAKKEAIAAVEAKLAKEKNYRNYYNAAVVYANRANFDGFDVATMTKYADTAIKYAAKAVEIGKKDGYDNSPYMNLLIGEMYFEKAYFTKNKANAEAALKNFQKVARLKPIIAPYNEMMMLAMTLGDQALAQKYAALDKEYTKHRKDNAVQAEKAAKVAQRTVKSNFGKSRKSDKSINWGKAGISKFWKF